MAEPDVSLSIGIDDSSVDPTIRRLNKKLAADFKNLQKLGGINLTFNTSNLKDLKSSVASPLAEAGSSAQVFKTALDEINKGTPSLRYAMYDIRNSMLSIAAASAAFAVGPIAFSIKYERSFANVVRTNQLASESLTDFREQVRQDLLDIAQTTPISWEDVTNIAALAGQLGIAQDVVAAFTETVAKFSATTDLTVDAAATAFGRLDQLIEGVDGNFEGLGSAILAVGVDSVATESQIVNVATQIASLGNLAGLTAPEIIGLSGAIASLGIRPELARGTVTRLFSNIGKSAVEGGYNVEEFGRITGRTAEQFVQDWGDEPGQVLQDFFAGINAEGPKAERTLRNLGITSVRDIPAILRLAQNNEEVARLIALSADEYAFATKVTEQYGIISSTTAEQLNRLKQNFETLGAAIGDSIGPLSGLIGFLNLLVQGATNIVSTPLGQFFSGVALVIALVVSALSALVGIVTGAVASFLAYRFASDRLGVSLFGLVKAALSSKTAIDAVAASSTRAAVSVSALGAAMRFAFGATVIGAVLTGITLLLGAFGQETTKTEDNIQRFFGALDGLEAAIKKDTKAFDELTGKMEDGSDAIRIYDQEISKSTGGFTDVVKGAKEFVDANGEVVTSVDDVTEALGRQKFALAGATRDYFEAALLQQDEIVQAFGDQSFQAIFVEAGGNISDLITAGIEGRGDQAIQALVENIRANQQVLQDEYNKLALTVSFTAEDSPERERFRQLREELGLYDQAINIVGGTLGDFISTQSEATEAALQGAEGARVLADGMEDAADKTAFAEGEIDNILNSLFEEENYIRGVEDALGDYAQALAESTDQGEAAQKVVEEIFKAPGQDIDTILGNLGAYLTLLEAQAAAGYNTAVAQQIVRDAINLAGTEAGVQAPNMVAYAQSLNAVANFDATNFQQLVTDALNKVGTSAGGAAEKVKTLAEQFKELTDSIFDPIQNAQDAAQSIFDLGESYAELGENALYASGEIRDAVESILESAGSPEEAVSNLNALFNTLANTVGSDTAPSLQFLRSVIDRVASEFGVASNAIAQATLDLSFFEDGVQSAQKEVRTLLDYASDIESVISRAFDIRFADILQIDRIADSWQKLSEQVEDARAAIEQLKESQQDLAADRAIKSYFLSVAESYGDMLRAAQLRKELADLDAQQAQAQRDLAVQQQLVGGDLTGTGEGSREGRAALLGLVQEYQDYITVLAESGASQDELRAATARARAEFIQQATELGFQEQVVLEYAQAFDDVTTAIDNVPRNITVDANVNPALQALNELNAKLNESIDLANKLNQVTGAPPSAPSNRDTDRVITQYDRIAEAKQKAGIAPSTPVASMTTSQRRALGLPYYDGGYVKSTFASGGYTGAGGKFQPAGIVHKGEYVVPKQYVNQSTRLPNANFLAQLQNGMRGYAQGGFVGGMGTGETMMVELSPYDRKLLADAGNVQLRLNGRVVAEATNASNYNQARRGSN